MRVSRLRTPDGSRRSLAPPSLHRPGRHAGRLPRPARDDAAALRRGAVVVSVSGRGVWPPGPQALHRRNILRLSPLLPPDVRERAIPRCPSEFLSEPPGSCAGGARRTGLVSEVPGDARGVRETRPITAARFRYPHRFLRSHAESGSAEAVTNASAGATTTPRNHFIRGRIS